MNTMTAQDHKLQKKAQKEYLKKIKKLERLINKSKVSDNDFNSIVPFFEELTGLEAYRIDFESCFTSNQTFIFPNQYNIEDWKHWYNLNKEILYFDELTNRICLIQNPKNLIKNPIAEYKKYLSIIDLDYSNYYEVSENLFDYAYTFLENLTGYNVIYDHEYEFKQPTSKDILFYTTWLQEHKEKLYWNLYTQKVELRE